MRYSTIMFLVLVLTTSSTFVNGQKLIEAKDFVNSTNICVNCHHCKECSYGEGLIMNNNSNHQYNMAEYVFQIDSEGPYEMYIRYCAKEARPVDIIINGIPAIKGVLNSTTGGWHLDEYLAIVKVGVVNLKKGENRMKVERSDVFPHILEYSFK